jgi:cold shock CspA family protein
MTRLGYIATRVIDRRFGFIRAVDLSRDYFFHSRDLLDAGFEELDEGAVVTFDVAAGPKGFSAVKVRRGLIKADDEIGEGIATDTTKLDSWNYEQHARVARKLDSKLVEYFQENPEQLQYAHAAFFEELYSEFLKQDGYAVQHISSWNTADGGVDLIGLRSIGEVPVKIAVQCKRYTHERRVSAEPVRSLAGVLDRFSAHIGVVATTSFFTRPAIEESKQYFWRINLQDYNSIKRALLRLRSD